MSGNETIDLQYNNTSSNNGSDSMATIPFKADNLDKVVYVCTTAQGEMALSMTDCL